MHLSLSLCVCVCVCVKPGPDLQSFFSRLNATLEMRENLGRYPLYLTLLLLPLTPLVIYFSIEIWKGGGICYWSLRKIRTAMYEDQCVHGYLSAADRYTCVCNSGWVGPKCDIDALPSCIRGPGQPCMGDLRFAGTAENQTCECVAECVEHTIEMMRKTFGDRG